MGSITFPLSYGATRVDSPTFRLSDKAQIYDQLFGGTPSLIFDLPLTTSLVPKWSKGSPTPTFTRATAAYANTYDPPQTLVNIGEARFSGARRVYNKIVQEVNASSTNFSVAAWGKASGATVTGTNQLNFDGTANGRLVAGGGTGFGVAGDVFTISFDAYRISGSTTVKVTGFSVEPTIPLTGSKQRYSFTGLLYGAATQVGVIDRTGTVGSIFIDRFQLEIVTGQSNQNPSEYVSVGVLSAPYHGAGIDGVKYFSTLNGNVVV